MVDLGYRCPRCGQELAHLDTTPAGMIRGVLGWLHRPGELILDRYGVVKVLGKGGFAAAYLVEDLRLNNKRRAIKELPQGLYDEAETGVLSQLSHPSIPDIIDRVHQDGMVYLVMEFGGSRTLESERQRWGGRLPYATLLPWLQQLGGVLSYLHHQSPPIIHRDLKPENVLLDEQGRVMLIDFGIAKQAEDGSQTRTLARAATHGFSPPEQALGTGTDPRSDVYALAATAYALLTGQVPPPAHQRVAGAELTEPQRLVSGLPEPFAAALLQALNLNINLRPASVQEFLLQAGLAVDMPSDHYTGPTPVTGPAAYRTLLVTDSSRDLTDQAASVRMGSERLTLAPVSTPVARSRTPLWIGAGALAALGLAGGGWLLWERGPEPQSSSAQAPPAQVPTASAPPAVAPVQNPVEVTPVQPVVVAPVPGKVPAPEPAPKLVEPVAGGTSPEPVQASVPPAVIPTQMPEVVSSEPVTVPQPVPKPPDVVASPDPATQVVASPEPGVVPSGADLPASVTPPVAPAGVPDTGKAGASSAMAALEKKLDRQSSGPSASATVAQEAPKRPRPAAPPRPAVHAAPAVKWEPGVHLGTRKTD